MKNDVSASQEGRQRKMDKRRDFCPTLFTAYRRAHVRIDVKAEIQKKKKRSKLERTLALRLHGARCVRIQPVIPIFETRDTIACLIFGERPRLINKRDLNVTALARSTVAKFTLHPGLETRRRITTPLALA